MLHVQSISPKAHVVFHMSDRDICLAECWIHSSSNMKIKTVTQISGLPQRANNCRLRWPSFLLALHRPCAALNVIIIRGIRRCQRLSCPAGLNRDVSTPPSKRYDIHVILQKTETMFLCGSFCYCCCPCGCSHPIQVRAKMMMLPQLFDTYF